MRELHSISDEWLTMMHGVEKRYSLGWFEDEYIRNCQIATINDADGIVTAFTNLIPAREERSLDRFDAATGTRASWNDGFYVCVFICLGQGTGIRKL